MDWLKSIPGIGPLVERFKATHAWRSYERLDRVKWSRLAAAMTFISFLAVFPLITMAAAIAAATLSGAGERKLERAVSNQVPGISDQLDISGLVDNAGTVGVIAGVVLLFTGVRWISSMRECLRAVWELPDPAENPVVRKAKDAVILAGLGGAGLASLVASTLASSTVGWTAGQLGVDEHGWGVALLQLVGFVAAVAADFLVLLYVLTLLPGVHPDRRHLITAALVGAIGFELLKVLLGGYIQTVAAKSTYGAFGVPIALVLWISFTAKLLLFCAAWTATPHEESEDSAPEPPATAPDPAAGRRPAGASGATDSSAVAPPESG